MLRHRPQTRGACMPRMKTVSVSPRELRECAVILEALGGFEPGSLQTTKGLRRVRAAIRTENTKNGRKTIFLRRDTKKKTAKSSRVLAPVRRGTVHFQSYFQKITELEGPKDRRGRPLDRHARLRHDLGLSPRSLTWS